MRGFFFRPSKLRILPIFFSTIHATTPYQTPKLMKKILLFCFFVCCLPAVVDAQWTKVANINGGFVTCLKNTGNAVFAVSESELFKSTDEGKHWVQVQAFPQYNIRHMESFGNTLYMVAEQFLTGSPKDTLKLFLLYHDLNTPMDQNW
jgi:hypothetical protein